MHPIRLEVPHVISVSCVDRLIGWSVHGKWMACRPSEKMKGKQRKEELDITESPSNLSDGDVQGKEPATPTKKSKKSLVNITYCRFNEVRSAAEKACICLYL
eukprot:scaffold137_cov398-Prasinococcus_capsulatus_cf.AAC.35